MKNGWKTKTNLHIHTAKQNHKEKQPQIQPSHKQPHTEEKLIPRNIAQHTQNGLNTWELTTTQ